MTNRIIEAEKIETFALDTGFDFLYDRIYTSQGLQVVEHFILHEETIVLESEKELDFNDWVK